MVWEEGGWWWRRFQRYVLPLELEDHVEDVDRVVGEGALEAGKRGLHKGGDVGVEPEERFDSDGGRREGCWCC